MATSGYSSRAAWIASALQVLQDRGIDGRGALTGLGLDIEAIDLDSGRASVEQIALAWNYVAEVTQDPAIGLRAALAHFNPAHWQSVGLAVLSSRSLRDALERIVRYHRIISDVGEFSLDESEDTLGFSVRFFVDPSVAGYVASEFGIAAILVMLRGISSDTLRPAEVHLHRPESASSDAFARLLQCPVHFGQSRLAIAFDRTEVDRRLPGVNPELAEYLDRHSQQYIERYSNTHVVPKVREAILRQLAGGIPTPERVAQEMHCSVRTLQRMLQADGSSFADLLRQVRMELARDYMASGRQFGEIGYLLGFSGHSNFSRAFKRWFGVSPSEFRSPSPSSLSRQPS